MKYWKECQRCGGKGWLKNADVYINLYREKHTYKIMECPDCVNGKIDATAEFRQMQEAIIALGEAIDAARLAIESAQYTEALNILDESVRETK